MEGFKRHEEYSNNFYKIKKFNSTHYCFNVTIEDHIKSFKLWIAVSSGKKRKDLMNFDVNVIKRDGGIKVLMWLKRELLDLPETFMRTPKFKYNKKKTYICIEWADNRRRNIYERLINDGYHFVHDGNKMLRKKIY